MLSSNIDGYWDIVVTSFQDICNSNESLTFDNLYGKLLQDPSNKIDNKSADELIQTKEEIQDHKSNIETAKRLVGTSQQNLQTLISLIEKRNASGSKEVPSKSALQDEEEEEEEHERPLGRNESARRGLGKKGVTASTTRSSSKSSGMIGNGASGKQGGKLNNKLKNTKKLGRSYYTSKFNPLEPILVGSEVAYKLKNRHFEEWIQCEVMRVIGDGIKFEIRDPEPDENNNPGQTFKANYKEILLIPKIDEVPDLASYSYGTKVLARYPETTTFYPAIVVGERKDRSVRLKFDGEEEVNKETEVERRLVLPFPEK